MSDDQVTTLIQLVSGVQASMNARFDGLAAPFARLSEEVRALEARFTAEMATLRADFLKSRTDIMERLDRLQNRLQLALDDINVNLNHSTRSEQIARNVAAEHIHLSAEITGMHKQIANLQAAVRELQDKAAS